MVQPVTGAFAGNAVFPKIMGFIDAHIFTHAHDFAACRFKRVGTPERRCFKTWFFSFSKIIDNLKTILRAPDSPHIIKNVIHWSGAQRSCGGEFFVGVGHRKPLLVIFDDFWKRVAGIDPVAETGHIHGHCIALCFTFDHPLGKHQTYAAPLTEARHHTAGRPVIPFSGYWTDQRVSVWRKGKGAMDHVFDTCLFKHRKTFICKFYAFRDLVEIIGQQFMAKIPRRAIHRPRAAALLVKPDAQSATFLAKITFPCRIHNMGMFAVTSINLWDVVSHYVLVFHGMER